MDLRSLVAHRPFPPPLPISTLIVSLPKSDTDAHWEEFDYSSEVSALFELVSPTKCIVRTHQTNGPRLEYMVPTWATLFSPPNPYDLPGTRWPNLEVIFLSNALVDFGYWFTCWGLRRPDRLPLLRVIVDLTTEDLLDADDFDNLPHASDFVECSWENVVRQGSILQCTAVVSGSTQKTALESQLRENRYHPAPQALGVTTFVDVATPRVCRFSRDLDEGAYGSMDWAAFEEH
jgi:hypothetical protein